VSRADAVRHGTTIRPLATPPDREAATLRLTELLLFLTPFVAFAVWRLTAASGGPSRVVLVAAAGVIVLLAAMLVWFSREQSLPPGTRYVPAQLEGGRVVPGHGSP
jgi:hypothetical protein